MEEVEGSQFRQSLPMIGTALAYVLLGTLLGFAFTAAWFRNVSATDPGEKFEVHGEGKLTNPLLLCDQQEDYISSAIVPFKPEIDNYISKAQDGQQVTEISYYFRELKTGYWITVEANRDYSPASLLKVPLYMTIAKLAEKDPGLWDRTLMYQPPTTPVAQNYAPDVTPLTVGENYTVKELANRLILESDNGPLELLATEFGEEQDVLNDLYKLVGVTLPNQDQDFITVGQYAIFFRLLYNASFLSQESSEFVLEKLTKTHFDNGIRAGVPEGVTVAHKFGERKTEDYMQLHDCGIVYHPNSPYLVCIMTRGNDFSAMEKVIASLSQLTWDNISQ